ncbi:alpha/beta fold hydrolase [Steroidobacter sp.]|uniref:alpha/beta fold hydrolase n=1 Tax=Steroidobacter sp. TaxID=1978227 RepID=UPI001A3E5B28|nr:hypothetical protein [Steroidobacter sp.]MBL8271196.1 hypothetical protein [Steroidobacter sp.]
MNLRIALNAVLVAAVIISGCASPGQRIEERARGAGLDIVHVAAGEFPSRIYMKRGSAQDHAKARGRVLTVYLESDGIPWRNGTEPSADPTTHRPLALEMLIRSDAPAAYIPRPCYQGLRSDKCTTELWTGARYSSAVVNSMVATVREAQRLADASSVALVGYSGGGTLAVLIAERLDNVTSVVTIAANLDTDAWTAHHHYLPLSQSLNPALSDKKHSWPELHLRGANDTIVPPATTAKYFERHPQARQRTVAGFDHVCCWVRDWPKLSETPTPLVP